MGVEKILKAPPIGITKAGTQRVVYATSLEPVTLKSNNKQPEYKSKEDEIVDYDQSHIRN
jgi:hypothetical protein